MRSPLRRHDLPPITDGAVAVVIARADKARELCDNPVWISGFAHYSELHYPGMRDLTSSPSTTLAAKAAGLDEAPVEVAEIQSAFTHEEPLLVEALGLGADVAVNPSGGPLAANPIMATGLVRVAEAARPDPRRRQAPHARALDVGSVPATEPGLHPRGGRQVSHQPCAIVGIGQTHHKKARRWDVSYGGLAREAALRALDDAQMTWSDIDAVVVGKAPDLFEGVMKPELYLTDALGAAGKPMFRVHTAGSVGGTTGIVAAHHVEAGRHQRVLAVALEKQSEGNAQFALGSGKGASIGAGGAFAPYMRSYMHRTGAPDDIGPMVAVKDRQNAMKNPYAHLKLKDISLETVKASPMMWDPVRFLESCPSSDGACAVVFTDEAGGERGRGRRPTAGVDPRLRGALRAVVVPGPRPGPPAGRGRLRGRRVRAGRHHQPARSRSTAPSSTCRSAGTSRCGSRPTTSPPTARAGRWSSGATPRSTARSR